MEPDDFDCCANGIDHAESSATTSDQNQPAGGAHLWPCGCISNNGGAHRRSCPAFETVEENVNGLVLGRRWVPREGGAR